MKIKTGIAIPMMAAKSARAEQAEGVAEQKTTAYAQNDVGGPSPELSQPSSPESTPAQASSGERGNR